MNQYKYRKNVLLKVPTNEKNVTKKMKRKEKNTNFLLYKNSVKFCIDFTQAKHIYLTVGSIVIPFSTSGWLPPVLIVLAAIYCIIYSARGRVKP